VKSSSLAFALLSSLLIGAATAAVSAETHAHQQGAAPAKLQLNHGKKWPTDAPLRQAMAAMRNDLAGRLPAIHQGKLASEDYVALGKSIASQVGNIISQCKLEPDADAMLHIVIADLLAAAETMQGKTAGQPVAAAHRAVVALNSYGQYFADPEWRPIR